MKEADYVPGFDWLRIIGSIIIVLAHNGLLLPLLYSHFSIYRLISFVVPAFFITSGALCARGFSKERVFRQVVRYGSIYLAISLCLILYVQFKSGHFQLSAVLAGLLKSLVCRHYLSVQLWFIPALLYPMILNAFLNGKSRKAVIAATAILLVVKESIGDENLLPVLERFLSSLPEKWRVISAQGMNRIGWHILVGLLYTTIGFDIATWKVRPVHLLPAVIPLTAFDLAVHYTGITCILLSILFYWLLERLPGKKMYPYHMEITYFAGTMYFLHFIERYFIIRFITWHTPAIILLTIAINLFLALAISRIARFGIKKEKTDYPA